MTVDPGALADLHRRCFTLPRPWTRTEIAVLLDDPTVFLCQIGDSGFLLGRIVLDEAEVLTLAVDPGKRRAGLGARLMADYHAIAAGRGALRSFLEVAADNAGARSLYEGAGYSLQGRRPRYYSAPGRGSVDALILGKSLLP